MYSIVIKKEWSFQQIVLYLWRIYMEKSKIGPLSHIIQMNFFFSIEV